ncbi:hypothetical protein CBP51_09425 [Cellvibrio mixtus]|uniref:Uncharacterized protein n=1 Tax=Cellvibrio mixtus TaxID=39650 RepID=A0A266QC20_9GAMM|nr:hypothetical protein CBP51_09425 [Cellvibrio mixtus]
MGSDLSPISSTFADFVVILGVKTQFCALYCEIKGSSCLIIQKNCLLFDRATALSLYCGWHKNCCFNSMFL